MVQGATVIDGPTEVTGEEHRSLGEVTGLPGGCERPTRNAAVNATISLTTALSAEVAAGGHGRCPNPLQQLTCSAAPRP